MAINEFRIGNFVSSGDNIVILTSIDQSGKMTGKIINENGSIIEGLSPLPIDSHLLLKYGFEKTTEHYVFKIFASVTLTVELSNKDRSAVKLWVGGSSLKLNYDYFHQIQNIYFDLAGKDFFSISENK